MEYFGTLSLRIRATAHMTVQWSLALVFGRIRSRMDIGHKNIQQQLPSSKKGLTVADI